jgi:hypothetical protein
MYQATSMTRCERACRVLHTFAFFFVAGKTSRDGNRSGEKTAVLTRAKRQHLALNLIKSHNMS